MPTKAMAFPILCVALICVATMSVNAFEQTTPIPNWVKNNAKWWSDGSITDEQYISGIQYLVSQGTIRVPNVQVLSNPAPAVTGIEKIVTSTRTNSSVSIGYYGLGEISCKSDETLTGGGYYSSQFREMLSVYRDGPSDNGKTWLVEAMYVGYHYYGPGPQFTVYGMCTKLVP